MSMFQGATQIAITGGTQIAAGAGSNVTINHGGQPGLSSGKIHLYPHSHNLEFGLIQR